MHAIKNGKQLSKIVKKIIILFGRTIMAKYIVEESYAPQFEKNYKIPFINLIPGIVWSIPLHQYVLPDLNGWQTFGVCALFVIVYYILSIIPWAATIPCVAGAIILTMLAWYPTDFIGNNVVRIIVKVLIVAFMALLEICIWFNATLPWMEGKLANKPTIRVEK